jgi:hypothetical protein
MQYQGAGPRFEHKLIQLQRERQSGQLNAEVYENQLTALIEEEVMSQEQEWQATRRGQLWAQAQERWNYLEHGNEPNALQVQEQQEVGQQKMLQPQRAEEEKVLPQTLEEKLLAASLRWHRWIKTSIGVSR